MAKKWEILGQTLNLKTKILAIIGGLFACDTVHKIVPMMKNLNHIATENAANNQRVKEARKLLLNDR